MSQNSIKEYMSTKTVTKEWLDQRIKSVGTGMQQVAKKYVQVCFDIACIKESEAYKQMGFSNIYDFTQAKFQMSRGMTSNLIKIARMAYDEKGRLLPQYANFGFGQLREIAALPEKSRDNVLEQIAPSMTVAEIKDVVEAAKSEASSPKSSRKKSMWTLEATDVNLSTVNEVVSRLVTKLIADNSLKPEDCECSFTIKVKEKKDSQVNAKEAAENE